MTLPKIVEVVPAIFDLGKLLSLVILPSLNRKINFEIINMPHPLTYQQQRLIKSILLLETQYACSITEAVESK